MLREDWYIWGKFSKHIWAGDIIQGEAETTGMNFQFDQMSVKERFERLRKLSAKSTEIILFIQKHTKNIYVNMMALLQGCTT